MQAWFRNIVSTFQYPAIRNDGRTLEMTLNLSEWNRLLLRGLVEKGTQGKPLYLYVDSEILKEIVRDASMEIQDPRSDFLEGFKLHYSSGDSTSIFSNAVAEALHWIKFSTDKNFPPFLPLLAVCVLAVTDPPIGTGVYKLLNHLIGLPARAEKPPGYERMPEIWLAWSNWLDNEGAKYGRSTTKREYGRGNFRYQGGARSQGFIRTRDRGLLTDFFTDKNLPPHGNIEPAVLLESFYHWIRRAGTRGVNLHDKVFGIQAKSQIGNESTSEIFGEILADELSNWDGLSTDESGKLVVRGLLGFDDMSNTWSILLAPTPNIIGKELICVDPPYSISNFGSIHLIKELNEREIPKVLEEGFRVEAFRGIDLRVGHPDYFFLSSRFEFEGEVQVHKPMIGIPYRVLCRRAKQKALTTTLEIHGARRVNFVPAGFGEWMQAESVVLLNRVPPAGSRPPFSLDLDTPLEMEFAGGLCLGSAGIPRYLLEYPPSLMLPELWQDHFRINGEPVNPSLVLQNRLLLKSVPYLGERPEFTFGSQRKQIYLSEFGNPAPISTATGKPVGSIFGIKVILPKFQNASDHQMFCKGAFLPAEVSNPESMRDFEKSIHLKYQTGKIFLLTSESSFFEIELKNRRSRWSREFDFEEPNLNVRKLRRTFPSAILLFNQSTSRNRVEVYKVIAEQDEAKQLSDFKGAYKSRIAAVEIAELLSAQWSFKSDFATGEIEKIQKELKGIASRDPGEPQQRFASRNVSVKPERNELTNEKLLDLLLMWISEADNGVVSEIDFENAWYDLGGDSTQITWWEGIQLLESLGHVEHNRGQKASIRVFPPTLNILPNDSGMAILSGARPRAMLTKFVDGNFGMGEEIDEALRAADFLSWAQPGANEGLGPQIIGLRWSPNKTQEVDEALRSFRIGLVHSAGSQIVELAPSVENVMDLLNSWNVSPSSNFEKLCEINLQNGLAQEKWLKVSSDAAPGLYRYKFENRFPRLAMRVKEGGVLHEVTREWIRYLFLRHSSLFGNLPKVQDKMYKWKFIHDESALWIPKSFPIPSVLRQALVLDSGVTPNPLTSGTLYRFVSANFVDQVALKMFGEHLASHTYNVTEMKELQNG